MQNKGWNSLTKGLHKSNIKAKDMKMKQIKTNSKPSLYTRLSEAARQLLQMEPKVASFAVLWFMEDGDRRFLMVRAKNAAKAKAGFAGVIGYPHDKPANENLKLAMGEQLGSVLLKSLNKHVLDSDQVAAAPTLKVNNSLIQALVWEIQITPEQAQLCAENGELEIVTIPEFALLGPEVKPMHKALYQSVLKHIHAHGNHGAALLMSHQMDVFSKHASNKVLH